MSKPILFVVGTRAEAIKLIPLYLSLKNKNIKVRLCATFQHSDMLEQVLNIFGVRPDFNLNVMKDDQDLFYLNSIILQKMKEVYLKVEPLLVIVHGDTTTTMASAMAAFYLHIPIGHVEAGLRTGNMNAPFPEEMNRRMVGQISTYHFAPTAFSVANLLSEGISRKNVFCTGNTIIDSLYFIRDKILAGDIEIDSRIVDKVKACKRDKRKIFLLTAHRRESFNGGLYTIFSTVKNFIQLFKDVFVFSPIHPNPNVLKAVAMSGIEKIENIYTCSSLPYKELVYILMNSDFVATDSGGIQEEAAGLGKPVLAMRDVTERCEGIWEGIEKLVGTDEKKIFNGLLEFYNNKKEHNPSTIYGDGHACERIVSILEQKLDLEFENNDKSKLKEVCL